ncbi:MAG: hypothetical protein ABEJ78_08330 [Haloferacaceae archaeon]
MDRTRWWYVLVGLAGVNLAWSVVGVLWPAVIPADAETLWTLAGGPILVFAPVFYYALSRELGAVRESRSDWTPNVHLWIAGGVSLSLLGVFLFLNPLVHYVAGLFLIRRFRNPALLGPETEFE